METLSGSQVDTWVRSYAMDLRTAVNACRAALPMLVTSTDSSKVNTSAAARTKLAAIIDTPQNRADMPSADIARWVAPTAIAQVILFLLSNQASAVTGALLPVTHRC